MEDVTAPVPKAGVLRISPEAIQARMRRVFTPNVNGDYKVSADIVKQWQGKKKGRKSLQQLFQAVGFDTEALARFGFVSLISSYGNIWPSFGMIDYVCLIVHVWIVRGTYLEDALFPQQASGILWNDRLCAPKVFACMVKHLDNALFPKTIFGYLLE